MTEDAQTAPTEQKKKRASKKVLVLDNPGLSDQPVRHDGKIWLPARGKMPASVMFVTMLPQVPATRAAFADNLYDGKTFAEWHGRLRASNVDVSNVLFTSVVKYHVPYDTPHAVDIARCLPMLMDEIRICNPKLVVAVGAAAFKALCGSKKKITSLRGTLVPLKGRDDIMVMPIYDLPYLAYDPGYAYALKKELRNIGRIQRGEETPKTRVDYTVVRTVQECVPVWADIMSGAGPVVLAVDCEWHGDHWADPTGWLRTVQVARSTDKAYVFEIAGPLAVADAVSPVCPDRRVDPGLAQFLKILLCHERVHIIGHNAIADGEWLYRDLGIELRTRTVYDTMLAEHLLDSDGAFGLTELVEKYTPDSAYDAPLETWKSENKALWDGGPGRSGYGAVPAELLYPYAAIDAAKTLQIAVAQKPLLVHAGYMERRGKYPSVHAADMGAQRALYDIQRTGILVDKDRLSMLTAIYNAKRKELLAPLAETAASFGIPDFNPESGDHIRAILFDHLGLTPIRTTDATDSMPWAKVALQDDDFQESVKAAADGRTLDILQDAHPFVKQLKQYRGLAQACKVWLSEDRTKGLWRDTWPDGRLHPNFSMLKKTGRFGSSGPNVQNFPKKAEGAIEAIFGAGNVPPPIRSIFIAPPGWVIVEADWVQAELFVLAGLSSDSTMMNALTTPGKDLHDLTAVSAFDLKIVGPDGAQITDDYLVRVAAEHGEKEYKSLLKKLTYVDARGATMSRDVFKSTVRVSAKNLNFGIPYGRGALDIAIQVKGETGTAKPINDLAAEIQLMMDAWKERTYRAAWAYMQSCAASVSNTGGAITTPWGTRRIFHATSDNRTLAGLRREAQNFPVQGTVAETCKIALYNFMERQREHPGRFMLMNQIHDAVQVLVREDDVAFGEQLCRDCMGGIEIPMPSGPLCLGVDVEHFTRWGEKHD